MIRRFSLILFSFFLLSACSEYQRVLKSTDSEYKLTKAKEYYEDGKYEKALPLFDELLSIYKGSVRAEEVYYYYSSTLFGMKDYYLAAYHYKVFSETFPSSQWAEEAEYQTAYCFYLESPAPSLDQAYTYKAINEFQLFVNRHPSSTLVPKCNELMDELRGKLEKKSFELAKQYFRTRQYQAAVQAVDNSLNEYPDTPYREEAMYIKLKAAFELADNSIESKKSQRFKETLTAYYDFTAIYPESGYRKAADKLYNEAKEKLQQLNT